MMIRCILGGLILLVASVASAQSFEIVAGSGEVVALVEITRGGLTLQTRDGRQSVFGREVRYDSADGRYVGYIDTRQDRVLRFPRSGSGAMQTANLQDANPRFRYAADRVVRPTAPRDEWFGESPYPPSYRNYNDGDPYLRGGYATAPTQSLLIESRSVPLPPLSPALIRFTNGGPREIQVRVVDLQAAPSDQSMRIRPGGSADVSLQRDPGSKRIERYQVVTPTGASVTREFVKDVPPEIRYEVVVHEWAMQSIAIDRTGKSPDPIEDINFQGKGLGRFVLPAGDELQSGTIDAFRAAVQQDNQGAVAPILAGEDPPLDSATPLERAMIEAQRAAQQGRGR